MNRRIRTILLAGSLLLVIGMLAWLTHVLLAQADETAKAERRIKIEALAHEAMTVVDRRLAAFVTFEQSRGYYEYAPAYAHKRPYGERMDAPSPGEATRASKLVSYLPDNVTAFIQITPQGKITGPALSEELSARLNATPKLAAALNKKVAAMVVFPATGNLWADVHYGMMHQKPSVKSPAPSTQPTQVESVSAFVQVAHEGELYILRQVHTNHGIYLQGALMSMDYLNEILPAHLKSALPECRLVTFDPFKARKNGQSTTAATTTATRLTTAATPPTPSASTSTATVTPTQTDPPGTLYFGNEPLIFHPGAVLNIQTKDYGKMLFWTLTLIWSLVILGAAGVIWLMLSAFRLEQRRGDFVSAVTHELRTPLTSFSLYTEMLEDGLVPEHKKQEYYANMQRECRRLEHLIDNVLAYSRLQRNAIRRSGDTLTCQELFEPIAEKIERRLTEAGFQFTFILAQPIRILPIKTDSVAVEQIMDNLTTNAIKYAKVDNARVQLTVQADRHHIVIRFRDNGPGISKKNARLVFLPFSRTRSATESRKPGVGLGLALAQDTARSLGGDLQLEFGALSGASFLLTLPKA